MLEIDLTAKVASVEVAPESVSTRGWTYNGGLPGPLIRARAGDRLIVHFKNELPQPTTVHWHGVVPIEMDGVPGSHSPTCKPATHSPMTSRCATRAVLVSPARDVGGASGLWLYGALSSRIRKTAGVADQLTLVLSDIGFDRSGTLESAESGGPAGMVFGREGAYVLVNGKIMPKLRARSGAPQRWRIVNTAKSRFFFLDLEGQPFVTIGSDGGLRRRPSRAMRF